MWLSHWRNQDKSLIWQQLGGRSYWHNVNQFIWAYLHEYNQSVLVGRFVAKRIFFLPTLSDAHLTAHFLRVAGAQICIWFGLQKHLSVSRFRFLFCKSSCCQPPKSICQSHVANFVSLIFSLLPIPPLPSTALKFPEAGTLFKIVRFCIGVRSNKE